METAPTTLGIILAGGKGSRLYELTEHTCKPAVPFGGSHRIIDWTMANLARSNVDRAVVALQYKPKLLCRHLDRRWASLMGRSRLMQVYGPACCGRPEGFSGTADALRKILDQIEGPGHRQVLVLGADHIYRMDYDAMIAAHLETGAFATVAIHRVPRVTAHAFGVLSCDPSGRVAEFLEKPLEPPGLADDPSSTTVSMGIYVFEREWLVRTLANHPELTDIGHDLLPIAQAQGGLYGHSVSSEGPRPFYWRDVGTLDAYREAQIEMAMTRPCPLPGEMQRTAMAPATDGQGNVCMPGASISAGARVRRTIVAPDTRIPGGLVLGEDPEEDARWFRVTPGGTTLVTPAMLARYVQDRTRSYWMASMRVGGLPGAGPPR